MCLHEEGPKGKPGNHVVMRRNSQLKMWCPSKDLDLARALRLEPLRVGSMLAKKHSTNRSRSSFTSHKTCAPSKAAVETVPVPSTRGAAATATSPKASAHPPKASAVAAVTANRHHTCRPSSLPLVQLLSTSRGNGKEHRHLLFHAPIHLKVKVSPSTELQTLSLCSRSRSCE